MLTLFQSINSLINDHKVIIKINTLNMFAENVSLPQD